MKSGRLLIKLTAFHRKKDNLYNLFRIFVPTLEEIING